MIDGSGDVPGQVAKLKEEIDGNILVSGSRRLAQDLLEHDLVDELRLMVFPVVLGTGDRLFDEFSDKTTWSSRRVNRWGAMASSPWSTSGLRRAEGGS